MEVYRLANIKSAKKRILVNETKAARNKAIKSKVKTSIKKVEAAVAA
ncbi:MAG TPA: 30S ribosomal protein S20, partial [Candidatus Mediterraneibacter stercorigallinarum]|nr:30S ribosomal protein S20 [Candidatus Mediterraneibacter stercorigallinarum]